MKRHNESASYEIKIYIYIYIKQAPPTGTLLNKVSDGSRKYVSSQIVTVVTGVILH